MKLIAFSALSDNARLWCFHAPRALAGAEVKTLSSGVEAFLLQWQSHGAPVTAGYEIRHNQFVLIGAEQHADGLAGCSMDSLRDAVALAGRGLGVELIDSPPIVWRDSSATGGLTGGVIRCAVRAEFKEVVAGGSITPETVVFDETIQSVGELRQGRWELPLRESWHAKAFRLNTPARA